MLRIVFSSMLLSVLLLACPSSGERSAGDRDRDRELQELQQRQSALERKQKSLELRLGLLSDKVDTAVPKPPPKLDVVHLVPPKRAPEETAELDEYGIGAEDTGGEPVVIRIYGDKTKSSGGAKAPSRKKGADARIDNIYAKARAHYQQRQFEEAAQIFARIVRDHPRHSLADNAAYWRGMCSAGVGDHAAAIELLQKVPVLFPKSPKVPDALFDIAEAYHALNDEVSARVFRAQLVQQYPKSEAAGKARAVLEQAP